MEDSIFKGNEVNSFTSAVSRVFGQNVKRGGGHWRWVCCGSVNCQRYGGGEGHQLDWWIVMKRKINEILL